MLIVYEIDSDNILGIFETYRECAAFFNTTENVLKVHISRKRRGLVKKKRYNGRWVLLERVDFRDEDDI
mgnify:CR=1 FL=1